MEKLSKMEELIVRILELLLLCKTNVYFTFDDKCIFAE